MALFISIQISLLCSLLPIENSVSCHARAYGFKYLTKLHFFGDSIRNDGVLQLFLVATRGSPNKIFYCAHFCALFVRMYAW